MLEVLYAEGFGTRTVYQLRRAGRLTEYFYFVFQRDADIDRLFTFLYQGVEDDHFLSRKRDTFITYFAERNRQGVLAGASV
jgi:hypothetical protein